jgi:DNA-binding transcriptional LysR family regulator
MSGVRETSTSTDVQVSVGDPDRAALRRANGADIRDALSIKITWLRSFLAVADCGGFGAATIRLHLSQSRVSAHISALETALGYSLFDRRARPTTLTRAGEVFRGHAEAALSELQEGAELARIASGSDSGRLVVGSYPSVSSMYLPGVLAGLKESRPGIAVELVEGTASTLESALVNGSVDVAFRPLQPPMRDDSLRASVLWREAVVAVMRDDDPLAALQEVPVGRLIEFPLIGNPAGTEEDGGGFDLRRAFGERGSECQIAYLTDQPATLVALVRAAFGIGVISQLALSTTSIEGLVVRRIESETAFRDVAVFWDEHQTGDPVLGAFLAAMRSAAVPDGVTAIADVER